MKEKIKLIKGNIVDQEVDAIVNAANSSLIGGGGVDGAIHKAGGPAIAEELKVIREKQGGCPTGHAVITGAGNLKAKYVIHAVGPIWKGGNHNEDNLLASAYVESLKLADEYNVKTIAFPSISTGAYGFPVERAARIALRVVSDYLEGSSIKEVRFVLFSDRDYEVYSKAYEELDK
ncbi:MAG: Macro domain-containing protein [Caldanaerobacter subterraneus]|uniref:O-acetyl-ADP-ribose deacetylase n=1 Tax=Caldanaerobacter subterraneus TaxID=911092 RepID=A0A101E4T5_9THEO|nr:O-acetyl-ADP-ribose deacetylase [Caldanaerobacter subterraneus]KUK08864.1 MAG: Macro domain-containing protein [Caldanaerobacter subterraneus]TCO63881.1 O-acetyl-ADP-ribose deacetylase (regulator of RNase III) [Caldanaerobacter subterraneus]HBT49908.1 O-acetyl-ADP-ribose deacetylase [Caldanaerobacter subterraneus]